MSFLTVQLLFKRLARFFFVLKYHTDTIIPSFAWCASILAFAYIFAPLNSFVSLECANSSGKSEPRKGKLTLPEGEYNVGDVIRVVAQVKSGPTASIKFTIVEPSKSVLFKDVTKNKIEFESPNADEQTVAVKVLLADTAKSEKDPGEDGEVATVTYTMNNDGVVRIVESKEGDKITIYPLASGKVTITAKTSDGKTGKLTVNVKK